MDKKTDVPLGIGIATDEVNTSKDASASGDGGQGSTGIKTEGKFDVSLIKTILGEMKSEFNRDLDLVNNVKSDDNDIKKKETRSSLTTDRKPKEDVTGTKNSSMSDSSRVGRARRSSESSPAKTSTKTPPVSLTIRNTTIAKDETKESSKDSLKDVCRTLSQDVKHDGASTLVGLLQKPIALSDIKKETKEVSLLTVAPTDNTKDCPVLKAKIVKTSPLKNIVKTEVNEPAVLPTDRGGPSEVLAVPVMAVSKDGCQPKIVSKVMSSSESKETSQDGSVISTSSLKQESPSSGKPRIVLTLKTTDDTTDGIKKLKSKVSHAEIGNDEMWTVKVDSGLEFSKQSPAGKRSLRSQNAPKFSSEPEGVKRSARRRSKDLPRESVLQSAIARKEKSFSLGQSDDKPGRSPKLRSPLSSPIDKSLKSPESRRSLIKTSKSDVNNVSMNFELLKVDSCASAEAPVKNAVKVKQELDNKVTRDPSIMLAIKSAPSSSQGLAYTKTGKRRYKPYKGLRYSLTSGNVTRRSKVTPRTRIEESPEINNSSESQLTKVPDVSSMDDTKVNVRTASPLVDEVQQEQQTVEQILKRKAHPDIDCSGGDESKRARQDSVPSPSPGDSLQVPAKPESTAISSGAGTAALCLCQRKSQLFVSTTSGTAIGDIYCQAVDSLDDRLVGCCNSIVMPEVRMLRPSRKVPYLILCDVHTQRLLRHNCCPGCGVFCTQGKFVRCPSRHFYHRDCQLPGDICPHCGDNSPPEDSMLFFKSYNIPVFVPQQKPPKKLPSAKMGFVGMTISDTTDKFKFDRDIDDSLCLPCGREVSAFGLSPTVDNEKLESLLNFANNVPSNPSVRYTVKSLIQASKTGNAERLISALASGLSPNTIFGDQSQSCLHLASNSGSIATVHVLVQSGAELDVMDKDQYTPLMLATLASNNAVVKYLVKAGASVTLRGNDGQTALHLAAKSGNLEACHYLLSVANVSSSYINSEDDGGWTPLVWAAEHCHTPVAKFLLERRADPLVRDAEQNVALHWAAFSGSVDISEMLLNYGCDVNSVNVHGDSPLHIGARQNMYHCVLLLLMRGAKVAVKNKAGDSPVDCCSVKPSDCHTVISLNMQLQAITNHPARRLLTNDISRGKEINPVQCVNNEDNEGEPTDFIYVSENCYTSNIVVDRTITSLQSCRCTDKCTSSSCLCANISLKCWYDSEGKLLPDFNFADPPMLFECNQGCACNRITCHNRVVQHGLTCRFQLFRTREKGWGVRTLRLISKGSYVCEYIGEIISDCEADHREDDSYLFDLDNRDGETFCIDARHYGNVARFINHMCIPNLIPVRVFIDHQDLHFPRIAFFANRDIEPDEELGFDYGEKFWIIKCKSFTCTCGAEQCRYSDKTIQQTLDNYNKRLQLEESLQS